jgi:hypothetical protein
VTPESRGTAPARLAAATLIAQYAPDDASITLLKEAYRVATNRVERGQIAIALCDAYANTARWSDLLAAAHLMDGNYSVSDQAFGYIVQARTEAKQWKELIQDAELHLKTSKNDRDALYVAAYASLVLNNDAQTSAYLARLLNDQWIGAEARTLSGWRALLRGTVDDKTLKLVDERTGGDDADSFYLAGLIQVALGKVDDARHSLASGLAKADLTKLDAKPWVLLGKIQAQYGLANAASTSFAQARKASSRDASSAWALTLIDLGTEPGNTVIR